MLLGIYENEEKFDFALATHTSSRIHLWDTWTPIDVENAQKRLENNGASGPSSPS
jgi:hypothetical protein